MIDAKYSVRLVASKRCCMYNLFTAEGSVVGKHGVHLPSILFVNFLLTFPFSINLVPIMSLRFLFRRKAKIGGF